MHVPCLEQKSASIFLLHIYSTLHRFHILMVSQVLKVKDCETVINQLEKTCELTTLLQREIASILKYSFNSEIGLIFEELQSALKLSLNLLCNGEVIGNNGIQSSPKRRRVDDYQEEPKNRNVCKEVLTPKPYDDGYLWRKYGRKNILNSMFPRDYYRCIYSTMYNCKAKKYVQRSCNGDPPLYKVIYIHNHTCNTHIANSQQMLGFSAKEIPQSPLSLSSYGIRREEEEHAAFRSCLESVIGGTSRDQQKEIAPYNCDDVVSQPMEASSVGLASSYHEWEMDDMVMMDLFWSQSSEMDQF